MLAPKGADRRGSAGPALRSCGFSSGAGLCAPHLLENSLSCPAVKQKPSHAKPRRPNRVAVEEPQGWKASPALLPLVAHCRSHRFRKVGGSSHRSHTRAEGQGIVEEQVSGFRCQASGQQARICEGLRASPALAAVNRLRQSWSAIVALHDGLSPGSNSR